MSAYNATNAYGGKIPYPEWTTESRENWVFIPVVVLTPIISILVAIRIWARHTVTGLATEDWVLLGAFAFCLATDFEFIYMTQNGYGRHLDALPREKSVTILRTFWLAQMTYKISLQLTKISLLLLYIRIFRHIAWFKKISMSVIGFLLVYLLATTIVSFVQCQPIERAWNRWMTESSQCISLNTFFVFNGTIALTTDIIVLLLPLPLIWGLQLPLGQKLALIPVFGLGLFIVVVSTLRLHALIAHPTYDTTWDLEGTLWTIIEFNIALMCAALPSVRVLLVRMFPGMFPGSRIRTGSTPRSGAAITGGSKVGRGGPSSWSTKSSAGHNNGWSKMDSANITLSAISSGKSKRDIETSSEEIILEGHGGIKKTVQYDVEYGSVR